MNSDPTLPILEAVVGALRTAPEIEAAFAVEGATLAVWSEVPAGDQDDGAGGYPYLHVAELQVVGEEPISIDGELVDDPSEVFVTVRAKSRPRSAGDDPAGGKPEAARLIGAARGVLTALAALPDGEDGTGFRIVLSEMRDSRHFTDSDGVTATSVATFRFEVEPAEA